MKKINNTSRTILKLLCVSTFLILINMSFSSCSLFNKGSRSNKQAQHEMQERQNKAIDEEVKKYDELYNEQTDRQAKDQKKMIEESRKKPKHMNSTLRKKPKKQKRKKMGIKANERKFFLWRWLGI